MKSITNEGGFLDKWNRVSDSTTGSMGEEKEEVEVEDWIEGLEKRRIEIERRQGEYVKQENVGIEVIRKVIDWMFAQFWRLDFENQSIFICMEIMKSYLMSNLIQKAKLQVLAVTCMFITSKFIQVKRLKMDDVLSLCQNNFTCDDIVEMEYQVLISTKFQLNFPTLDKYLILFNQQKPLSVDIQTKILFWFQISLLQNILIRKTQKTTFYQIVNFVISNTLCPQMIRLISFSKSTEHQYIMKRFMSYFDVESYLTNLNIQ